MFGKIKYTEHHPPQNVLIWDGKCGFCKFWKTRWEEKTKGKVIFKTYQESAENFKDFPIKEFKKASRLIETDGKIYSGPDSAYRSLWHAGNKFWHQLYASSSIFEKLSNHGYNHIAKNRSFYFKLTKFLFGKDPLHLKPYWLLYLVLIIILFSLL
ncbi:thiol-disulfide oxidoreductase DCC family protein [Christiangramia sp. SM2212]|uniref:DCC1-like thiol-disulfide oxidoreductase family protein n=1 Tax=Christiangramia sediminicola TaxID=3073267 RepID=A0ABU1EQC5_9FLAO|nr:DCC1-like thiol-disulfide oxidoreductase family protein [Christiangramia sp. SM2212]MDR5590596.1 DCC1-like thiol-disulfide oxidoreductase family protein [Christiangramia sp. SM2212]